MLRKLIFKIIRYSGLPFLFREWIQKNKATILLYHNIGPELAEKSWTYLAKKYNIISLRSLLEKFKDNSPLPPKTLVITFDDGWKENYKLLPVIKKLNIPITIFLCAGLVDTYRHFWFTFRHPEMPGNFLKQLPNKEKIKILKEAGFDLKAAQTIRQVLSKAEIIEMSQWVDFQSHTLFHPCLPFCTDEEARKEIMGSKQYLEERHGLDIYGMAFPNGDYSERDIALLKAAGYQYALSLDYGFNTAETDKFRLKRLSVNDADQQDELIVKASGVWWFFKTWNGKRQGLGKKPTLKPEKESTKSAANSF